MAFKFLAITTIAAVAHAGIPPAAFPTHTIAKVAPFGYTPPITKYSGPISKTAVAEEYDPHPQYSFAYEVQDGLTGDSKSQHEFRDGDVVQGSYTLIDADGFKRTVEYTSDPHNGFNAVVHREPLVQKSTHIAKVAALAYSGPAAKDYHQ
ncbi:hypothetical protein NQ314_009739 [Rhamnusium bicolor]|uniref:Uncharacterized protein n=1 Tax=Rhamnusium bicolor TaxID=1586634 RepID=A0AAV8XYB1_9CUCU|nr:hypothetical protein NQ314_009739 [Rhamnusium bicolor]